MNNTKLKQSKIPYDVADEGGELRFCAGYEYLKLVDEGSRSEALSYCGQYPTGDLGRLLGWYYGAGSVTVVELIARYLTASDGVDRCLPVRSAGFPLPLNLAARDGRDAQGFFEWGVDDRGEPTQELLDFLDVVGRRYGLGMLHAGISCQPIYADALHERAGYCYLAAFKPSVRAVIALSLRAYPKAGVLASVLVYAAAYDMLSHEQVGVGRVHDAFHVGECRDGYESLLQWVLKLSVTDHGVKCGITAEQMCERLQQRILAGSVSMFIPVRTHVHAEAAVAEGTTVNAVGGAVHELRGEPMSFTSTQAVLLELAEGATCVVNSVWYIPTGRGGVVYVEPGGVAHILPSVKLGGSVRVHSVDGLAEWFAAVAGISERRPAIELSDCDAMYRRGAWFKYGTECGYRYNDVPGPDQLGGGVRYTIEFLDSKKHKIWLSDPAIVMVRPVECYDDPVFLLNREVLLADRYASLALLRKGSYQVKLQCQTYPAYVRVISDVVPELAEDDDVW